MQYYSNICTADSSSTGFEILGKIMLISNYINITRKHATRKYETEIYFRDLALSFHKHKEYVCDCKCCKESKQNSLYVLFNNFIKRYKK